MESKTEKEPESKICESCGEAFGCGAKLDGCWCVDFKIPPCAADDLKTKYSECVCPKCLTALAETDAIK